MNLTRICITNYSVKKQVVSKLSNPYLNLREYNPHLVDGKETESTTLLKFLWRGPKPNIIIHLNIAIKGFRIYLFMIQ